ncbi:sporulation protein [Thalassobacillus pellis]|uniref:sporulation protein n=1 Tax=Thalassobacillus pellis TaxID=748008 RepID=UPI00195FC5A2|nr:sporulation protein [Thalassobacillus pellis]MBM7553547.1 sporulation-control protein [Thalassobacillus pellis]
MITKMLSLINFGSPKVDLVLENDEYKPGKEISGFFQLHGGWMKQKINRLECDLVKTTPGKKPEVIEVVTTVLMSHMMKANEQKVIPFQYDLPHDLSPSDGRGTYHLQTKLVFENDVKSFDHDEVVITRQS